jgi:hypothetical protein
MKACAGFIVGGVSIAQIESGEGKHLQREHPNLSEEVQRERGKLPVESAMQFHSLVTKVWFDRRTTCGGHPWHMSASHSPAHP